LTISEKPTLLNYRFKIFSNLYLKFKCIEVISMGSENMNVSFKVYSRLNGDKIFFNIA